MTMVNDETSQPFYFEDYTVGLEKTFRDGLWSAELRMPFMGSYEYSVAGFNFSEPEAGNLTVTLKRLIYQSRHSAAAVGLGINTPTGGGTTGQIGANTPDTFMINNDALYLLLKQGISPVNSANGEIVCQKF